MQTMVMDGNFVSEHLQMQNPEDDVFLADGHGFMVGYDRYEQHIAAANETREVGGRARQRTCPTHAFG